MWEGVDVVGAVMLLAYLAAFAFGVNGGLQIAR